MLIQYGADPNAQDENGKAPLHHAIEQNNQEIVQLLVQSKADLNAKDKHGRTPLDTATYYDHKNIIILLIDSGAEINSNMLLYAVQRGNENIITSLISHGANVNVQDNAGETPLHIAVDQGNEYIVTLLLLNKADVNIKDAVERTPIDIAIGYNNERIIQLLIQDGTNVSNKSDLLYQVTDKGYKNVVEVLISKDVDLNFKYKYNAGGTLLHLAAKNNYQSITRLLIERGVDVNAKNKYGKSPLDLAILHSSVNATQLLIDQKAQINLSDYDVFSHAVAYDLKNVVEYCINKVGNVDMLYGRYGSLLHYAAEEGHTNIAELLIEADVYIDAKSNLDQTPLALASLYNRQDVAKLLICSGADINIRDAESKTPLHYAAKKGYMDIAELLINSCADVDVRDIDGKTPLFLAIGNGNQDMVVLLTENGASINIRDRFFNTPLHYAAYKNDGYPILKLLVVNGADIYASNQHNQTAMSIAIDKNNTNVTDLLINSTKKIKNTIPSMKKIDHYSCGDMSIITNQVGKHPKYFYPKLPFQSFCDLPFCSDIATTQDVPGIGNTNYIRGNTSMMGSGLLAYFFASKFICYLNQKKMISDKKNELFDSICIGDIKKTTLLLKSRINPDVKSDSGQAPIHVAVLSSNLRIVKKLVRFGADINILNCNGSTTLDHAIYQQDQDMIEFLLDKGAKVDIGSTPTLYSATLSGKQEIVRLLHDRGADVTLRNDERCTALFPAVSGDYIEIASFLLESKANVNVSDIYGTYPIHLAVSHAKNIDMVMLLCDYGADINVQDNNGRTPISIAIAVFCKLQDEEEREKENVKNIIDFLLKKGVRIDIPDNDGNLPIHLAVRQMELSITVEKLLNANTDSANQKNNTEFMPLQLAVERGNLDVVQILAQYSSDENKQDTFVLITNNAQGPAYIAIEHILLQYIIDQGVKDGIKPPSVGSITFPVEFSKWTLKRKNTSDTSSSTKSSSFYSMSTQSSSASFKSCSYISTALCDKFNDLLDFDQLECDSVSPAVKRVKISR